SNRSISPGITCSFRKSGSSFWRIRARFSFGGAATGGGSPDNTPILFYSRRIGLDQGRVVPIVAGGRLTGRLGRFTLGMLNIQSDTEPVSRAPATNFSGLRLRRDVLHRSKLGVLVTRRSADQGGVGTSDV